MYIKLIHFMNLVMMYIKVLETLGLFKHVRDSKFQSLWLIGSVCKPCEVFPKTLNDEMDYFLFKYDLSRGLQTLILNEK